jgi:putative chitinase
MSARENERYLLARAVAAGITDPRELANFMGQMQVESGGFSRLSENLNYSGRRLFQVFRGRNGLDSLEAAEEISACGPEAIADAVYGGTWGKDNLRNTEPGDGWRYRGRGFVQLTGRAGYTEATHRTGIDLIKNPALAEDPEIAATIAVDYWQRKVVSRGHQFDVTAATKDINNGHNGLSERRQAMAVWEARFQQRSPQQMLATNGALSEPFKPGPRATDPRLQKGESGPTVRELQSALDHLGYRDGHGHRLHADGDFGDNTEAAVRAFQAAHGLPQVGRVGPRTRAALEMSARSPSPVDPAHPDHALQRQVSRAVDAMERSLGRHPDENSERLKASLLLAAKQQGLTRVDHVVLSEARGPVQAGQHVFAVQGRIDDPASRRVHVATQQALATPVQASWARLAEVEALERGQPRNTHAHVFAARHGEHGDGMRRMPSP